MASKQQKIEQQVRCLDRLRSMIENCQIMKGIHDNESEVEEAEPAP